MDGPFPTRRGSNDWEMALEQRHDPRGSEPPRRSAVFIGHVSARVDTILLRHQARSPVADGVGPYPLQSASKIARRTVIAVSQAWV